MIFARAGSAVVATTACFAVTLALLSTPSRVDAGRRRKAKQEAAVEAPAPVAQPAVTTGEQQKPKARTTFLDTVNTGREVALRAHDLEVQSAPEPRPDAAVDSGKSEKKPAVKTKPPVRTAPVAHGREQFRIQCVASTQADLLQDAQKEMQPKTAHKVSVVFKDPYYKLLVGEFATRSEAERALFDVKGLGYPDAWIVQGVLGE